MKQPNRYARIISEIFAERYRPGMREVPFEREELEQVARRLKIRLPKNLGDLIYSFRYRASLPESITALATPGEAWVIRPAGRSKYQFMLVKSAAIRPSELLVETKIPDATPGVIAGYALSDEQALLARLRYNRLIDIFAGIACYSLQNHLRTSVRSLGQIETDELYVGIDHAGAHYVLPVQAKGGRDQLSIVQIEQDFALCKEKFPGLICVPIGAQFLRKNVIVLYRFVECEHGVAVAAERHYRLASPDEISAEELQQYRTLARPVLG